MSDIARLTAALADRYRVERELGAGGMATVYLARDLKHDRDVAIKVLRPEIGAALGAERFLLEIKTTANLRHPHIVPLYDSGEVRLDTASAGDGPRSYLYYVMPLVEGESLRARMERDRQLPIDEALLIAREVADALSYAHARGVIHRDIKPENIMLEGGHAVVADFGIARALSEAGGERITQTGMSVGTPPYMSPEQASGNDDLDGRSDLYSLACVLYEMLGGQPPFMGPSAAAIVRQHLVATAPPITNLRPAVPAAVADALQRALNKSPADRFNPVAQFATALGAGATSASPAPAVPAVASPAPRRATRSAMVLGIAVLLIVLAVAVLVVLRRGATSPSAVASDKASVAVLPFADLSAERSSEYFGDGIAETLISALANVPGLDVAARTSAFAFRGKNVDVRDIGKQLGVSTVLEGSVQRAGDKLRITSQLVKVSDGVTLWSATFDRSATDIFAVQDEVTRAVITALKGRLLAGQSRGAATATRDPQAYDLYLQGRFYQAKRSTTDVQRAITLFEQAIARDSAFAQAWSGLADSYIVLAFYSNVPTITVLAKARTAADKAVSIDSKLGEAQTTRAYLLGIQDWNWSAADSVFQLAIALSPGYSTAYKWHADAQNALGRPRDAMQSAMHAWQLDPLSPIVLANVGQQHVNDGNEAEGMAWLNKALALDPNLPLALRVTTNIYFNRGDSSQFFRAQERLGSSSTRAGAPVSELRRAWQNGGRDAVIRAQVDAFAAMKLAFERAQWRVKSGDFDGAFRDLDIAFAERSIWILFVKDNIPDSAFKRDPRFRALLKRTGITEDPQR